MIIPYGTDAPIYHRPYATIGLIVLNTALWPVSGALVESGWSLDLGVGLHPIQWVTNNFLHAGLMHVAGNMFFLWIYGIVVEGKLGWFRFLMAYLAVGTAYGALVQGLYLGSELVDGEPQHVLGASAAIFGLLGMCVVWAPKNCFSCLVFLGFGLFGGFGDIWEIPIILFALMDVGWEILELLIRGGTGLEILSSALLHVCGFGMGFALGVVMLKADWVDCEGWDLFRISKKHFSKASGLDAVPKTKKFGKGKSKATRRKQAQLADDAPPEERAASAVERLRKRLDEGETQAALDLYLKTVPTWKSWGWCLPEPDLMRLIKAAQAAGYDVDSIPLLFDYVKNYPARAPRIRLKLAQLLIDKQERPAKALRVLEEIPEGSLPDELDGLRRKLAAKAHAMLEEGVLELETDE